MFSLGLCEVPACCDDTREPGYIFSIQGVYDTASFTHAVRVNEYHNGQPSSTLSVGTGFLPQTRSYIKTDAGCVVWLFFCTKLGKTEYENITQSESIAAVCPQPDITWSILCVTIWTRFFCLAQPVCKYNSELRSYSRSRGLSSGKEFVQRQCFFSFCKSETKKSALDQITRST